MILTVKLRLTPLLLVLALSGCSPEGDGEFSPAAHCVRRCEILFECLELPTGPSERDREEFLECVDDCETGLERACEREAAFECIDCWERRTCEEVTTGRCDPVCLGLCDG